MHQNDEKEVIISPGESVRVTQMGHIIEVQHMAKMNRTCHITRLDADHYMVNETGEVLEYKKSENRGENLNSLRQTFKRLRYLINNNFSGKPNELFVTFTFAKDSFDTGMIYEDFKNFMKRLRYRFKGQTTIDYLNVVEPHGSGQWHSHMLLRFNDLESVYIEHQELASLWGQGFIKIKALKDVDNIGAYVSAYLSDLEVPDDFEPKSDVTEVTVKKVDGREKKFIKGGRLQFYPPGMNLYRKSKGIVMPEREDMAYKDAKKIAGSAKPHYKKSYTVETDDFTNTITYEEYNTKRRQGNSRQTDK